MNDAKMLKNATFADLFLDQASKNINKIYTDMMKLQVGAKFFKNRLANRLNSRNKVNAAGKK
jgi:hypothetical protein